MHMITWLRYYSARDILHLCCTTTAQIKPSRKYFFSCYANVYSGIENTTKYVTNIKFDIKLQIKQWSPIKVLKPVVLCCQEIIYLLQYRLPKRLRALGILIFIFWTGFLFKWFLQENITRPWTKSRNWGQPWNPGELSILYFVSYVLFLPLKLTTDQPLRIFQPLVLYLLVPTRVCHW